MQIATIREALTNDGTAMGIPGSKHLNLYSDDVHVWVSGQRSPLAGHHHGRGGLTRLLAANNAIWPGGTYFAGNEYWWGGDSGVVHWFGRNCTWKGLHCHNSGMTVFHVDNGKISGVRVYTDSEFLAETTAGWRSVVPGEIARQIPAFAFGDVPSYPDPINDHTWAIDTATRDGRDVCPQVMQPIREQLFDMLQVDGFATRGRLKNAKNDGAVNQPMDNGINVITFQGRSTPLGGRYFCTREDGFEVFLRTLRSIWPMPSYFEKILFWFTESGVAFEWYSHSHTFKDQKTRNSGLTHLKIRDQQIFEHHEYTDTEFFSVVHADWRESFGNRCKDFPNYPPRGSLPTDTSWTHF